MDTMIKVLYIEDEEDIREITDFALEDEGFELLAFADGEEAIKAASSIQPDLLLLDMMMPGKDGLTVAKDLKALPHLSDVPIIFMTANVIDISQYKNLGVIGLITKPFDATNLAKDIKVILSNEIG